MRQKQRVTAVIAALAMVLASFVGLAAPKEVHAENTLNISFSDSFYNKLKTTDPLTVKPYDGGMPIIEIDGKEEDVLGVDLFDFSGLDGSGNNYGYRPSAIAGVREASPSAVSNGTAGKWCWRVEVFGNLTKESYEKFIAMDLDSVTIQGTTIPVIARGDGASIGQNLHASGYFYASSLVEKSDDNPFIHPDIFLNIYSGGTNNDVYMFNLNYTVYPDISDGNQKVHAFVTRLYETCLGRDAELGGLVDWSNILINKESSGAQVAYGFVFSDEYKQKNTSDEEFVEMLYNVFMDRPSDAAGKAAWVSALEQGTSREKVFSGFTGSSEFAAICESYGIERGEISLSQSRDVNVGVTSFCARLYTQALGRKFDVDGLNAWSEIINSHQSSPELVAESFINSQEFINKNLNNEEYVKVLYRTFLGREADSAGLTAWVGVLDSGTSRLEVLHGFSRSPEFAGIQASFGL